MPLYRVLCHFLHDSTSLIINQPLLSKLSSIFKFTPITGLDTDHALLDTANNCHHLDEFSTEIIKLTSPVLKTPYLIELFNRTIKSGVFSDDWILATIIHLAKVYPPCSLADTCLIALLPEFLQLFERVIYKQFFLYLSENNLLNTR